MASTKGQTKASSVRPSQVAAQLRAAAEHYMVDVRSDRESETRLRRLAFLAGLLASALVVFAAYEANRKAKFSGPAFFSYSAGALPLIGLAAALLWQGARHHAEAMESLRLRRQLTVLSAYVESLPPTARALVMASLAPRFFPQHRRAEDEMLMEHSYPPADQLLAAIDPEVYASVTGEALDADDE